MWFSPQAFYLFLQTTVLAHIQHDFIFTLPSRLFIKFNYWFHVPGFTLDKESNTIAILCQDVTVVLAFDTRERLIQWQVKIASNLGEGKYNFDQFVILKLYLLMSIPFSIIFLQISSFLFKFVQLLTNPSWPLAQQGSMFKNIDFVLVWECHRGWLVSGKYHS